MDSNTTSQIKYSTLASAEDCHSDVSPSEGLTIQEGCNKAEPQAFLPRTILIRVGFFVLLELGFIALAFIVLRKPILLSTSSTIREAKGVSTMIAIIWHALAIYLVKDILLTVFSAEWAEQYHLSHGSALKEIDIVSRLTTGFMDQLKHFFSRRATHAVRLGFISSLFLITIKGLGPTPVGVDFVPYRSLLKTRVANLTLIHAGEYYYERTANSTSVEIDSDTILARDRANMITRLEHVEQTRYGFSSVQQDILIPWPSSDSIPRNATITYMTDIIKYNFSCSWKHLTNVSKNILDHPLDSNWTLDNGEWIIYGSPLKRSSNTSSTEPVILPMEPLFMNSSLTFFIFAVSNTTITLNLEGIPSVFAPGSNDHQSLLISFLLCDPQFQILPAKVNVTELSLEATILPGNPVVKNIPLDAANVIFSQSLLDATATPELVQQDFGGKNLNSITRLLFLHNDTSDISAHYQGIKPLSVNDINQQMNKMLLSSSKAFLSGYRPGDNDSPKFEMMETDAVAEVKKMALVGSKPFLIALTAVVGLVIVLLVALLMALRGKDLQIFTLENILRAYQLKDPFRLRID